VKQGLRFWFKNDEVKTIAEASELGGRYQVRLPSPISALFRESNFLFFGINQA
jgi:hypothetical protein